MINRTLADNQSSLFITMRIFHALALFLWHDLLSTYVNDHLHVHASSFHEAHSHQGVVTPFQPGDPKVTLDNKARGILKQGKPYQTQVQKEGGTGGRGLVVQDIDAPPSVVWGRILDYDHYASMVPKTIESKNYDVVDVTSKAKSKKVNKSTPIPFESHLSQIIYTRMKVGFPLLKLEFFIKHLYYPSLNSLTWTLDYSKLSDFNDSCGYWYVIPHPENDDNDNPTKTRVYYSVEVSMFDWVPKFVVDFMSTKALTDATAWVKKYSEMEYGKEKQKMMQQKKEQVTSKSDDIHLSSSSGRSIDDTTKKDKTKKKGLFGGLFRNKKKDAKKEQERQQREQLKQQEEAECIEEEKVKEKEMEDAKKILRLSWIRLGLVSVVSIFVVYDFHLWISG